MAARKTTKEERNAYKRERNIKKYGSASSREGSLQKKNMNRIGNRKTNKDVKPYMTTKVKRAVTGAAKTSMDYIKARPKRFGALGAGLAVAGAGGAYYAKKRNSKKK